MKKISKRYKKLSGPEKKSDKFKFTDVIEKIKQNANTKFDESIDLSMKINLKQTKGGDFNLRTVIKLPSGSGKKIKVAVLCDPDKVEEAKSSGADIFGSQDLIDKMSAGELNFDKLICTPSMMSKIGKLGKVLGPKGLMPNPKLGTVTQNIKDGVKDLKSGMIEVKNDKDGNVGVSIGKKSFPTNKLEQNFKHLIDNIKKERPDTMKGELVKSIYLTSTMGKSFQINTKGI